ncbi:MAG: YitT family protein [Anaerolineae bacterium]|nr:YitT family protein [Anaerolineae bacterium]
MFAAVNRYLTMLVGIFIGAVSVIVFMSPFQIAPAGATGVAVIMHDILGTPIGLMILLLNIPIQIIAWKLLPDGAKMVLRTIFVLVVYSFVIDVLAPYLPEEGVSQNVLLNAIFGGVLGGISTGLMYRAGATFGGSSTLALIMQRRLGTPMSSTYLYIDGFVMGAAGLAFGWESALHNQCQSG